MAFAPRPSPTACQARARSAAGLRRVSRRRVASSIAAAPARSSITSIPWSAAGRRPTALVTDVRPPTQSHIGNRARKPCSRACRSSALPSWVIATAWAPKSRPRARVGGRRLDHAVAGLGRAPGLRDDDGERLGEAVAEPSEHAVEAVGVGVVEEVRRQAVAEAAEGVGHELRAEGRPADADDEHAPEALGAPAASPGRRERERRSRGRALASRGWRRRSRGRAPCPGPAASSGPPCASRRDSRSAPCSSASIARSARWSDASPPARARPSSPRRLRSSRTPRAGSSNSRAL